MTVGETVAKAGIKLKRKRKGHPIGKLGIHVKRGLLISTDAFFRENRWEAMPRIGEGSIRP